LNTTGDNLDLPPIGFPSTRWTLVTAAAGANSVVQPIALAELVRLYAPALRAYLLQVVKGDVHQADDLLQGFLTDKVLEQKLIGHAAPTRGRFRTFLLAALDHYVIDIYRKETAAKRSAAAPPLTLNEQHQTVIAHKSPAPQDAFDLIWAREVIGEALAVMRGECQQSNRADIWTVFDLRYLKPATDGTAPEPHESLAGRLNLNSAAQASNLLITSKRMFTRIFKSVVARYAADEAEVKEEIADLWRIFASARSA
jgi:DNA-directed RNA polymerase specialized sigma24 family protein